MRFAIGQITHETCTFCAGPTRVADFQAHTWLDGDAITRAHRGVRSYLGGMIDGAGRHGIEFVPTFAAGAVPSGTITREALDAMRGALLRRLRLAGRVDAVCLALHGAGAADGVDDIESYILHAVREAAGPGVPVVATLDLHANMTAEMLEHADALLGVKCYPHTDSFDRGEEAVGLALKLARNEVRPVMHLTQLPMMIPTSATTLSPAKDVNARCREWEARAGVLDCTFFHGFPQTDIPSPRVTVLATADGDADLARRAADDVAEHIWAMREQFLPVITPPAEAIHRALAAEGQPVIVNEPADNPGGGAPGDGTHLLRAMLEAKIERACFGFVCDPETVRDAHRAGVGETIAARVGGKSGSLGGAPIEARVYIKVLTDGRFVQRSPMGAGTRVDLGPMARLVIDGVDVLVSTRRQQTFDPEVFLLHGIDVRRYKIVALKSENHFRAGFEPIAAAIVPADAPGLSTRDLTTLPYRRLLRPVWPLDREAVRR